MQHRRGFVLPEAAAVVVVGAVLLGLLLPALAKARQRAKSVKDAAQIKMLHQACVIFANDYNGVLPTPGLIDRLPDPDLGETPGRGPEDLSANHSASLYSSMIMRSFFTPALCIGPTEVNPVVMVKTDYDWDTYDPIGEDVYWDLSFRVDIHQTLEQGGESNTSYAHTAFVGDRKTRRWRDTMDANDPVIGTRGTGHGDDPRRGGAITGDVYTHSPTLRLLGAKKAWIGNICFQDNHVHQDLDTFYPTMTSYTPEGANEPLKDNIFDCEFEDHPEHRQASADAFLVICTEASEFWCTNVYDPLQAPTLLK